MVRSRLKKRLERQIIKNLFLSILGIIVIVFLLIKFGIPLLVNVSLFLSGADTNQDPQTVDKSAFVATPILNADFLATNSARIKINGSSLPNYTVLLYVNGNLADKVLADNNGNFSSQTTLAPNENIIKAKSVSSDGKESKLSEGITIIFINSPPTLEISSPSDNQTLSKDQNTVEIRGKTDSKVRVTVNGFWAIIDENNNFSYTLALKDGENEIKIVAQDQAGNKTEKNIKVTYNP